VRRGVLSPLAAACGERIGAPPSLSMVAVDWKRSAATAPPLWLFGPGCGGRWGACIDTRCVSLSESELPGRSGRAGLETTLGSPRLAGAAPTPAGSPPWAGVSTPPGGQASESLELGGGMLSGDSRKRRLLGAAGLCALCPGSARSMAMLTYRTNRLPTRKGGGTVIRPAGDSLPGPGSRQLPG